MLKIKLGFPRTHYGRSEEKHALTDAVPRQSSRLPWSIIRTRGSPETDAFFFRPPVIYWRRNR
jgi:hypothetical protein